MNIHAQLLAFYKSSSAQNETVEVLREGGDIRWGVRGRSDVGTFANLDEAQNYAKEVLGLREVWDISGGQVRGSPFMQEFRRALATQKQNNNLRIVEEVYNLESRSQMESYNARRFKDGIEHGWQVADGKRVRLFRVITGDDPMGMTRSEIHREMRELMGYNFHGLDGEDFMENLWSGKYNKRAKAVAARKQIEAAQWASPYTVSVVDSRSDMSSFVQEETKLMARDQKRVEDALRQIEGVDAKQRNQIISEWRGNKRGVASRVANMLAEQEGHKTVDGISRASSNFFERMRGAQREMLSRLVDEASRTTDPMDLKKINQTMRQLQDNITYLDDALKHRRTFNVRSMGIDLLLDDQDTVQRWFDDLDLEAGVQIKGDIIWDKRLDEINRQRKAQGLEPIDIQTHYKNITNQGGSILEGATRESQGMVARTTSRVLGYPTLTPYNTLKTHIDEATGKITRKVPLSGLKGVEFDVQTMSSLPEFMNKELIDEAFVMHMERFESNLRQIEEGRIPGVLFEMLEKQASDDNLDVVSQSRARNLLDHVRRKADLLRPTVEEDPVTGARRVARHAEDVFGGDIVPANLAKDPLIRQQFINVLYESTFKEKGGIPGVRGTGMVMPNMEIPGTFRGYAKPAGEVSGPDPGPGSVRYDKESGSWVLHGPDSPKVYASFGGFDFDDALNGMIRIDPQGNLKVAMFRQPNARGEWQLFDIAYDDPAVVEAVRRRGSAVKDATFMDQYMRTLDQIKRGSNPRERSIAQRRMQRLLTRHGSEIFDLYDPAQHGSIPMRRGWRQMIVEDTPDGVKISYEGEPEMFRYLQAGGRLEDASERVQRTALQVATEELGKSIDNQHLLGKYSNARMFFDHFLSQNLEHLDELGVSMSKVLFLEQETVIDATQGMVEGLESARVERIGQNLIKQVIESTVEARLKEGGEVVGIDPEMFKHKATGNLASRYFEEYRERLMQEGRIAPGELTKESLLMSPDDPRATISHIVGRVPELTEVRDKALQRITYPEEVLDMENERALGIRRDFTAHSDSENILRTYRRSVARNMTDLNISSVEDLYRAIEAGEQVLEDPMRAVHDEVLGALVDTFDTEIDAEGRVQRKAGERTYKAIIRTAQRIEAMQPDADTIAKQGRFMQQALGGLSRHGLFTAAMDWFKETAEGQEVITLESMTKEAGRVYSRGQVSDVFRRILGEDEFRALSIVDAAISGDRGGLTRIGNEAANRLMTAEGSTMLPRGGDLMSVFDPRATAALEGGTPDLMSKIIMDYLSGDEATQREMSKKLSDLAATYLDFGAEYAARQDADEVVAGAFRRGLQGVEGGVDKMREAERVAAEANDIVNNTFKRMRGGTVAKIAAGVVALGAGGAFLRSASSGSEDRTMQDIQGPPMLPGGNPYSHPMRVREMNTPQYIPAQHGGVTYDIRANGEISDDLVASLQGLTGGADISTTNYM